MADILITGSSGFIGFHLAQRLLNDGLEVVGIDSMNDYYDPALKQARLNMLRQYRKFSFRQFALEDGDSLNGLFAEYDFPVVVHLAAQAGVRYSLTNPRAYIDANIVGFLNVLEACRHHETGHLIYASSSSVYGANAAMPFSVRHNVDHPVSLYAATKKANELMAHTYSHLYGLPTTGLRFFTVYGPWGRPDMAYFKFTQSILRRETINVFNYGKMKRDFTYVDDIVEGIRRLLDRTPRPNPQWDKIAADPGTSYAPYKIYNIGNNRPVALGDFIACLERKLGIEAVKAYLPMQPGDVPETYADVDDLMADVGFKPATSIEEGIGKFVDWYLDYDKKGMYTDEEKGIGV
ncbi:SDR family NAD(P)-dependent oxidoreductase [Cohnella sp. CFH 77786]|uniref:NAD-dependent epimerase n=1 Tax=Cohnella sp. CFH 77786 TaxID=2662265 RepID=UPI001C60A129|nr:NAD-dependent epimerase [Cohnella sp. CFH 77786]MBW5448389.1 SDR family NAD(P)-dependent oxidoreductase [Cohnella sp. CFH 77786]